MYNQKSEPLVSASISRAFKVYTSSLLTVSNIVIVVIVIDIIVKIDSLAEFLLARRSRTPGVVAGKTVALRIGTRCSVRRMESIRGVGVRVHAVHVLVRRRATRTLTLLSQGTRLTRLPIQLVVLVHRIGEGERRQTVLRRRHRRRHNTGTGYIRVRVHHRVRVTIRRPAVHRLRSVR